MADPLARLHSIDKSRNKLHTYSQRIKLARFFAPETEAKLQKRIDRKFNDLTRERRQLLEIIKADPILRQRHFDYEESVRKAATAGAPPPQARSPVKERDR
jgi:hypothetical protein